MAYHIGAMRCEGCGHAWRTRPDAAAVPPLWTTRAGAAIYLATVQGWSFDGDTAHCRECAAARTCQDSGHDWDTAPARAFDWVDGTQIDLPAMLYCRRCDTHLSLDDTEATPHPEHVDGLLTNAEQEVLTALEMELWYLLPGPGETGGGHA